MRKWLMALLSFVALGASMGCRGLLSGIGPTHIVFESRRGDAADIMIITSDGRKMRQLVSGTTWNGTPALSPDGKRLAFSSDRDGDPEIYVLDIESGNLIQLTDNTATDLMPVWSPDGTKLAFVSDRVYKVPLQGGSLEISAGMELYIMNADGSGVERLTSNEQDVSLYPSWSPDGTRIAYQNLGETSTIMIVPVPPATGEPVPVTAHTPVVAWNPAWSPDGKTIAFMGDYQQRKDIYRIDPDGRNLQNLTQAMQGLSGDPAWSPDSKWIVFASGSENAIGLFIMTREGKDIRQLTSGAGIFVQPHWSR